MNKQFALTLPATSNANVCALQTAAGAANLLINGTSSVGGVFAPTTPLALNITSTSDLAGVNFTVTGLNENGNPQTETRVGPTSTTVALGKYWSKVTQIAVDGAIGSNVSVGIGASTAGKASTPVFLLDYAQTKFNVGVSVVLSGTISVTVQETFDDVRDPSVVPTWQSTSLAAQTSTANAALTTPVMAIRMIVNSYTTGATASLNIVQGWT